MTTLFSAHTIPIQFTEAALKHIAAQLAKTPAANGFYLSTQKAGCSGYAYVAEPFTTSDTPVTQAETNTPFPVFVAKAAVPQLWGLTIDLEIKALGQKNLKYINPNEAARCGCGESFLPHAEAKPNE